MGTIQQKKLFEDYDGFVKKFERKKTTDDCYTPAPVFEVVKAWVNRYWESTKSLNIIRPFYPDKDYREIDYKTGDFVLDNPPFSLLAQIIKYYNENDIKFFLFAPHISLFNSNDTTKNTFIVAGADVVFENGACIAVDFITNLPSEYSIILAGDLKEAIEAQNPKANIKKYKHPQGLVSSALLGKYVIKGNTWAIPKDLTALCPHKDKPFGGGFCVPPSLIADIEELANKAITNKAITNRTISKATEEGLAFLDRKYTNNRAIYQLEITKK